MKKSSTNSDELIIRERFGDDRLTEIQLGGFVLKTNLIPEEQIVITFVTTTTLNVYCVYISCATWWRGVQGMNTLERLCQSIGNVST